jgi:RNA polymerase sigma-70 factor (ECF subfamily)
MDTNEFLDKELVEQYFAGDKSAFDALVGRYLNPIYHFVSRIASHTPDAQDLTQETFMKAWRQLKRFDTERSFKAWLFTIARNTSIDYLRKKKAMPISAFDDVEGNNIILDTLEDFSATDAEELFDRDLARGAVAGVVQKLSPAYQTVISLRYENDLTFQEISEVLGESIDTLKSRYRRALTLLKKEFASSGMYGLHQK